jgi:ferric-dicitrate binding protein FerR (iron transport regulator)
LYVTDPSTFDPGRLLDYAEGRSSSADAALIGAWLEGDPHRQALVDTLRRSRAELEARRSAEAEQAWIQAIAPNVFQAIRERDTGSRERLEATAVRSGRVTQHIAARRATGAIRLRNVRWLAKRPMALAATIAVGVIVVVLWKTSRDGDVAASVPALRQAYTTAPGQRISLTLDDRTRVTLAPGTTLGITRTFGRETRMVTLRGEAFFDVPSTAGAPFIIRTGNVTTRVLGTQFSVRRYTMDRSAHVAVISGKVSVTGATRRAMTLTAGAVGAATDSTVSLLSRDGAVQATAWREGMLVFREASARDVVEELSRWYGYTFRCADSVLAGKNVTARFRTNAPSVALDNLKLLLDVELSFDGKIVTLLPRSLDRHKARERRVLRDTFHLSPSEVGR